MVPGSSEALGLLGCLFPSLVLLGSACLERVVGREGHWQPHDSESFLGFSDVSRDLALLPERGFLGPRGCSIGLQPKETAPLEEPAGWRLPRWASMLTGVRMHPAH